VAQKINVFWFRRDLRLEDNAGLFHALSSGLPVLPVFIFDRNILDQLEERADKRVNFIYNALVFLQEKLVEAGSSLLAGHTYPEVFFQKLVREYSIHTVFTNHDYEPYARDRDKNIKNLLSKNNVEFKTYKDQVIFEKDEVIKNDGGFYTVFTPYSRKWIESLKETDLNGFKSEKLLSNFVKQDAAKLPSLTSIGFEHIETVPIKVAVDKSLIFSYDKTRNFPAIKGTSRLGIHLRFGTTSIRQLVAKAKKWNQTFLKELIWREFFMQILWHQPAVVDSCFKPEYNNIEWRNNEKEFIAWCEGKTGYPIVDAGMRQLNEIGFMHNRVRMITASFLVKHLLIDWRWGEAYFAQKLLDYELSSNNGNWQWVAGCGCDAAPYFRIFNPDTQTKKFDSGEKYIIEWAPEYKSSDYPFPIVQHQFARERCLSVYKKALSQKSKKFIQTNLFDDR
jgi:deoxyribodipyrimidine photo-lyase